MDPKTIRRIDSWIGRPACAALTAARWLPGTGGGAGPVRKILFIKMVEQGATVQAVSAVERAAEMVGRDNVYFWVFEENRPILDLLDLVPPGNVLTLRADRFGTFLADVVSGLARIRRIGIDATIDMEFFARAPAVLAAMTGARIRVGLHRFTGEGPYRGDLMTHRVQYNPYLHVADAYQLLVESLGDDPGELPLSKRPPPAGPGTPPRFEPTAAEVAEVEELLREACGGEAGHPLLLLNPNASDMLPLRKWPTDRFVTLGRRLLAEHPEATLVITGAPSEEAAGAGVARAIDSPRAVSLAGRTSLRQLLALYTLADVLVTNDSGPGHFSSLTGVGAVVLFGPETPDLFGPRGEHTEILYAGLACSPCVTAFNHRFSPCTDNRCMQAITVDQVEEAVRAQLARRDEAREERC